MKNQLNDYTYSKGNLFINEQGALCERVEDIYTEADGYQYAYTDKKYLYLEINSIKEHIFYGIYFSFVN